MANIELLTAANFSEKSLDSYLRKHEVKKVYRKSDSGYVLVEQPYIEDWDFKTRREIARKISSPDYITYVAVENEEIVGFIGLKKQLIGKRMTRHKYSPCAALSFAYFSACAENVDSEGFIISIGR